MRKWPIVNYADATTPHIGGKNIQDAITSTSKLCVSYNNYKFNFEEHLSKVCDKASQNLNGLARIFSYMNINQRKRIMRAFPSSQFAYCPLLWFFGKLIIV